MPGLRARFGESVSRASRLPLIQPRFARVKRHVFPSRFVAAKIVPLLIPDSAEFGGDFRAEAQVTRLTEAKKSAGSNFFLVKAV